MDEKIKQAAERLIGAETPEAKTNEIESIVGMLQAEHDHVKRCKMLSSVSNTLERSEFFHEIRALIIDQYDKSNFRPEEFLVEYPEISEQTQETPKFNARLCLPPPLAEYLEAVQKNIQVYPEMLALPLLTALAACVQGKAEVHKGTFKTPLCIYTMTVADPSERKSSSLKAFTNAIFDYRLEENKRRARRIREEAAELKAIESRIKKYERGNRNAGNENTYKADLMEFDEKKSKMTKPIPLALTDATTEAIIKELENNNGKAYILSSESGIIDIMNGLYTNGKSNIDILLQGYSGEPVSKSRVTGGKVEIDKALITIGTMAQPSKFNELIHNKRMSGQGLTSRFLFSFPGSLAGNIKVDGEPIPEETQAKYNAIIAKLMKIKEPEEGEQPAQLTLNKQAELLANDYFYKLEEMKQLDGIFRNGEFAKQFGGKQYEKFLRIAGIFHLAIHDISEPINEDTILKASRFSDWTIEQANKIINDTATESEADYRQKSLIRKLCKKYKNSEVFSERAAKQSYRKGFYANNSALLEEDLDDLAGRFFLLEQPEQQNSIKRKRSKHYKINPFLYSMDL